MIDSLIKLRPINSLIGERFYVPSYQRGYRWTERQVVDLLDDIWQFSTERDKDEIYCLQPVIVKDHEGQWELIDGQQRLTTIYIILSYLKKKRFQIEYETRKQSREFLENLNGEIDDTNIDFFHISSAFGFVSDWFQKIEESDADHTVEEEFSLALGKHTQVIWYQVNDDVDAIDIFTRINIGKIPLTNAELIKALFLRSNNFGDNVEEVRLKQLEIAGEWDRIEYSLQNDEFWYFLCDGATKYDTRIEFIFDLIAEKNQKHDEFYTFRHFSSQNISEANIEEHWKKIRTYFLTFEEWYNDKELYHLIGYLIAIGFKIVQIKKASLSKSKSAFRQYLKDSIRDQIKCKVSELQYGDPFVRKVLLLFNIVTLINNKQANTRFQFNRYKLENWDIEHIHSVQSEMPETKSHQIEWLKEVEKFTEDEDFKKRIAEVLKNEKQIDEATFRKLFQDIISKYGEDVEVNDISNLTLLDAKTNRGYKNAIFPIKRNIILERDREGTFIPLCTKNVFLKYYSNDLSKMSIWGKEDRTRYKESIETVLQNII